uniref:Uncharacterized protein n=1 Tax=Arundo donax TaxID=35708 RepID=A0A0A9BQU4_ARUDO
MSRKKITWIGLYTYFRVEL